VSNLSSWLLTSRWLWTDLWTGLDRVRNVTRTVSQRVPFAGDKVRKEDLGWAEAVLSPT
jgi:hypothetical protein